MSMESVMPCYPEDSLSKNMESVAIPFSSGPRFVRTLHCDISILGGPTGYGSGHWFTQAPSPWQGCDPWRGRSFIVVAVQLLSCVWLFATPCAVARQAPLSFTISWSLLKLMSIELVMLSNHLILCRPLLLPSIFSSIRVFSNESAPHIW